MTQLAEIESRLRIFCQGISGHPYQIHTIEALTEPFLHNPNRIPLVSTFNIYLPQSIEFSADDSAHRRNYHLIALQQMGYREFGTYRFNIREARQRTPWLNAIPLPPSHRESDLEVFYRHFDCPTLARRLFHLIESERVERLLLESYPGARRYREECQPHINSIHEAKRINPLDDELLSLSRVLRSVPGSDSKLVELVQPVFARTATILDSAHAVIACYRALRHLVKDGESTSSLESSLEDETVSLETLQRQAHIEEVKEQLESVDTDMAALSLLFDSEEGIESDDSNDAMAAAVAEREALNSKRELLQRQLDIEQSSVGIAPQSGSKNRTSFRYDEWDFHNKTWLRNWCLLHEIELEDCEQTDTELLLNAVRPHVRSVRRMFEQVRPTGMKRVKKQFEGDELDPTAAVDLRIDRRSGSSLDERVFTRRDRLHRDVATVLLVDLSASTDSPIQDENKVSQQIETGGTKPQDLRDPYFDDDYLNGTLEFKPLNIGDDRERRVIDVQREAILLLAMALETIHDMYAVYGFSGYGKDNVELFVAKDFNQSLTERRVAAIAAMDPKRSTRMGPAVRHAIHRLASTGSAMKVLLIVSDGFPQDCDYGPDRTDHEYGVQDTAKALQEADQKGIQSFCVTVDHAGHDYLRRMCRPDRYLVIDEVDSLPNALQGVYRRLTFR